MPSRNRQSPGGRVGVPASLPVPLGPAALQHLPSPVERPASSFSTSQFGPGRLPTVSSPAGRRPAPAAAPRPQGNRREPMTDRGPAKRNPPSTQPKPLANQLRCPHVCPSGWPIPKSVRPLMPAPGFRVRPIRKGVVPRLLLEGPAEGAQVSCAVSLPGTEFSAGYFLRGRFQDRVARVEGLWCLRQ